MWGLMFMVFVKAKVQFIMGMVKSLIKVVSKMVSPMEKVFCTISKADKLRVSGLRVLISALLLNDNQYNLSVRYLIGLSHLS